MKKQRYIYVVQYDETYEPTIVYGVYTTEKAAQKAIKAELKVYKNFRGWINKLPLNPAELSCNYLYKEAA